MMEWKTAFKSLKRLKQHESSAVSNFVTSNEITSNRYFLSNCNGN